MAEWAASPRSSHFAARVLVRSAVVFVTCVLAVFVPHVHQITSVMGSLTFGVIGFILPPIFHLRLLGHELSWVWWIEHLLIASIGVVGGAVGTYQSLG